MVFGSSSAHCLHHEGFDDPVEGDIPVAHLLPQSCRAPETEKNSGGDSTPIAPPSVPFRTPWTCPSLQCRTPATSMTGSTPFWWPHWDVK